MPVATGYGYIFTILSALAVCMGKVDSALAVGCTGKPDFALAVGCAGPYG